jgi:hypothetical protein
VFIVGSFGVGTTPEKAIWLRVGIALSASISIGMRAYLTAKFALHGSDFRWAAKIALAKSAAATYLA